jgi:spore coat protein CotF
MFNRSKTINDRVIINMLANAIAACNALSAAATFAANGDLKRLYKDFHHDMLTAVDTLVTYATDQGWIKPFASPDEQLQLALEHADEVVGVPV